MANKLLKQCLIKYIEEDNPDLYWELCYQRNNGEKYFSLNVQVPVSGTGIVHQAFPLDTHTMIQIAQWINDEVN